VFADSSIYRGQTYYSVADVKDDGDKTRLLFGIQIYRRHLKRYEFLVFFFLQKQFWMEAPISFLGWRECILLAPKIDVIQTKDVDGSTFQN
jgi:hypothetical protein